MEKLRVFIRLSCFGKGNIAASLVALSIFACLKEVSLPRKKKYIYVYISSDLPETMWRTYNYSPINHIPAARKRIEVKISALALQLLILSCSKTSPVKNEALKNIYIDRLRFIHNSWFRRALIETERKWSMFKFLHPILLDMLWIEIKGR